MKIVYLSVSAVLYLHEEVIKAFGGASGVRNEGALQSALARPRSTFGGQPLYPGIFEKAASLFESLRLNHPFADGTTRVAFSCTGLFLEFNGWCLSADPEAAVRFTLEASAGRWTKEEIRIWLEQNSVPRKTKRK